MNKIAFLFAGQGAQSVGMGKDLYDGNAAARGVYDMGEVVCPGTLQTCFEGPAEVLTLTQNTQPCLYLTDLACARALEAAGIHADMAAGFSLGEIPALAFAGVLTETDGFRLVALRGKTMGECAALRAGGMAAVLKLSAAQVEEICSHYREVYPVNYNCPGQISCAGAAEEMDAFCAEVKAAGGRAVPLAVSGAFHTPFMARTTEVLKEALSKMDVRAPKMPLYANLTGRCYGADKAEIVDTVSKQVCNSVRWEDTLRHMAEVGVDTFIEVGAGKTLTGLVKKTLPEATALTVTDMASLEAVAAQLKG